MQNPDPETSRTDDVSAPRAEVHRAPEPPRTAPPYGGSGVSEGPDQPPEADRRPETDGHRTDRRAVLIAAAAALVLLLATTLVVLWRPRKAPAADHLEETRARAAAGALEIYLQAATDTGSAGRETPRADLHDAVLRFYEDRGFAPAWIEPSVGEENGAPPVARLAPIEWRLQELLATLDHAADEGLRASDYRRGRLGTLLDRARRPPVEISTLLDLDVTATEELFTYAQDLATGRIEPARVDPTWALAPPQVDLPTALEPAFTGEGRGQLRRRLEDLAPPHPQYRALRERLARLRERKADADGPLAASRPPSPGTDGTLRTLELNMERWRWLPRDLGDPHLEVNVAGYRLRVVADGHTALTMPVVVGKRSWKTPFFHDRVEEIILNPRWNVPESIAVEDILPKVLEDPHYLASHRFEVLPADAAGGDEAETPIDPRSIDWATVPTEPFPYRFRQGPGADNALGRIKFLFPNSFNIYLHDTPADAAFARSDRALSHGCIRLSRPFDLAVYLLRDEPAWTRQKILDAVNTGQRTGIGLPGRPPVYILYWTAVVGADGKLHFYDDPYGVDTALGDALDAIPQRDGTHDTETEPGAAHQIAER